MPFSVDMRPHLQTFASTFLNSPGVRTLNITAAGEKRAAGSVLGFYSRIKEATALTDGQRQLIQLKIDVKGCHSGRCFSYNEENEAADGAKIWVRNYLQGAGRLITFTGDCSLTRNIRFFNITADVSEEAEGLKTHLLISACAYARSVLGVFTANSSLIAEGGERFSMRAMRQQQNGISFTLSRENHAGNIPAYSPLNIAALMRTGLSSLKMVPDTDTPALKGLGNYDKLFEIIEASEA